jgi:hypothetical protein
MFDRWGEKVVNKVRNSEWNWDGQPANWSRIWVILFDHGWTAGPVLGGTWPALGSDPSLTLGSTASPDEVRAARNIVRSFKEAHAICVNVIVVLDEAAWATAIGAGNPNGTWDNPTNRSSSACYWNG